GRHRSESRKRRLPRIGIEPMRTTPRILIVDDEPNVRLMFRTTLQPSGYRVGEAEDGVSALEQLGDGPVDLVLLDLQMPRLGGMDGLRRMREHGDETPVIIVTAHGSIPDAVEAMRLGAIDFLSKPVTPEALRRIVGEVIARHEESEPLSAPRTDRSTAT